MPNAKVTYTANGVDDTFSFSFPYLDKSHVSISVAGVTDASATWVTDSSIQTSTVPANGATVVIQRVTPSDSLVYSFPSSGSIRNSDLNNQSLQALYVAAENEDLVADVSQTSIYNTASIAGLKALDTTVYDTCVVTDEARGGVFIFQSGDYSTEEAADVQDGIYVKADDTATTVGCWIRQTNNDHPANLLWFGADPTDTSDNLAIIQDALDTVDHLYIPEGTYRVSGTITLTTGQVIEGAGKGKTILTAAAYTYAGAMFSLTNIDTYGIIIRDLALVGSDTASSVGIQVESTAEETAHMILSDLKIQNFDYGVYGNSTYTLFDSRLEKVDFLSCATVGFMLSGSSNTLTGCSFRLCNWGIEVANPSASSIGGGSIVGGLFVQNTFDVVVTTPTVRPIAFYNCWFEQTVTHSIGTTEGGEVHFTAMSFSNCLFQPAATATLDGVMTSFSFKGSVTFDTCVVYTDLYSSAGIPNVADEDTNSYVRRFNCTSVTGAGVVTKLADDSGASLHITPEAYGCVGDGSTDDATNMATALTAATGKTLYLTPGANYLIGTKITIPTNTTVEGYGATITKGGNIDLVEMATGSRMLGLTLQGDGATYTGDGVIIDDASSGDQRLIDVNIKDMNGYCVDVADDTGVRMEIQGGFYQRTTATNPAIRFANGGGAAESAGDRQLIGVQTGGGHLIDTGASQNTNILACHASNMTFGSSSLKTIVTGSRFATAGSDMTVAGQDHSITGNIIAGDLVLGSGVANTYCRNNVFANTYDTIDNTANTTNFVETQDYSITPIWKADSVDPAIGNGSMGARISRDGQFVTFYGLISMGSTTTFGTGSWYVQPTAAWQWNALASYCGSVYMLDSGTAFYVGTCYMEAGTSKLRFVGDGVGGIHSATAPFTWANGDYMYWTIRYAVAS